MGEIIWICGRTAASLTVRPLHRKMKKEGNHTQKKEWVYRRGDIYLANLNPFRGSEQGGKRPVLVLQNNTGNFYGPTLIVAPMTTRTEKRRNLPVHYLIEEAKGLTEPSMVLLEQIKTIDKSRILRYIGKISPAQMRGVEDTILVSLGLPMPEHAEAP